MLIENTFGFQIPESVVKTVLKNRLKNKEQVISFENGIYTLGNEVKINSSKLSDGLEAIQEKQNRIISDLIGYIEFSSHSNIGDDEKSIITDSFVAYLLDESVDEKYTDYISSYIISKQEADGFTEVLNAVREGFVLYNGVRYTPDLPPVSG